MIRQQRRHWLSSSQTDIKSGFAENQIGRLALVELPECYLFYLLYWFLYFSNYLLNVKEVPLLQYLHSLNHILACRHAINNSFIHAVIATILVRYRSFSALYGLNVLPKACAGVDLLPGANIKTSSRTPRAAIFSFNYCTADLLDFSNIVVYKLALL